MLWHTYEDIDCREESNDVNVFAGVWLNYKNAYIKEIGPKIKWKTLVG